RLKHRVLLLCTTGLLSSMAEGLLRRIDSEHFEATSAGISSGLLHPFSVDVMDEMGVDLSRKPPQRAQELTDEGFDYVITLDEPPARAYGNCQRAETIHWKFDDPIASSDPEQQLRAFRMVRDQIAQRLRLFVIVNLRSLTSARPVA